MAYSSESWTVTFPSQFILFERKPPNPPNSNPQASRSHQHKMWTSTTLQSQSAAKWTSSPMHPIGSYLLAVGQKYWFITIVSSTCHDRGWWNKHVYATWYGKAKLWPWWSKSKPYSLGLRNPNFTRGENNRSKGLGRSGMGCMWRIYLLWPACTREFLFFLPWNVFAVPWCRIEWKSYFLDWDNMYIFRRTRVSL